METTTETTGMTETDTKTTIIIVRHQGNHITKTIEGYRRLLQETITVIKDRPVQLLFSPEAILIQKIQGVGMYGSLVE